MSFSAQRIANYFPLWSKLRSDPSSFGQRVFSVFGEYFDWQYANSIKIKEDKKLTKDALGVGELFAILLEDDDQFDPFR